MARRIPDLDPGKNHGQETLFDTWRFHAFFTTTDPDEYDTVAADKSHRGHAIIEQVHSETPFGSAEKQRLPQHTRARGGQALPQGPHGVRARTEPQPRTPSAK